MLKLYNTFTKQLNNVELSGKPLSAVGLGDTKQVKAGSLYICGPTVYSDSHLGHALTYIRSDLLRRVLRTFFNTRLHTVMNITDIDDKILRKTHELEKICSSRTQLPMYNSEPSSHPFNKVSTYYLKSFLEDMSSLRILPADLYVSVSKHVHLISSFINRLERDGYAYIAPTGDVCFRVSSLKSYKGRVDPRQQQLENLTTTGAEARDFVLWKAAKPNEPVWIYKSDVGEGRNIPGRPGWHVQCSAISSAIFGQSLDFHFGGKDLIFPHHYNEEACCCAYHHLDTSNSLHVWAKNWLHSGHLILRDTKMSKSLGNVITIKEFISHTSVNVIRLLCIISHYRSDFELEEELVEKVKSVDHKLSAFSSFLVQQLENIRLEPREQVRSDELLESYPNDPDIQEALAKTSDEILEGICNDFHLNVGLESILNLAKLVYSKATNTLKIRDLISLLALLEDWCQTCGLEYGRMKSTQSSDTLIVKILTEFRENVRSLSLKELSGRRQANESDNLAKNLLKECDDVRAQLDELGFVHRDTKFRPEQN